MSMLAFAVGCSQSNGKRALSGSVTLNGQPLKSGSIQFESLQGQPKAFSSGGMISDGRFAIPGASGLPPGKYRAMINAASTPFMKPGPPGSQPLMDTKELVPASYNTDSKLIVEVKPSGDNTFNIQIR
jgi:hypothetical protein